jgi:hypothetical protein
LHLIPTNNRQNKIILSKDKVFSPRDEDNNGSIDDHPFNTTEEEEDGIEEEGGGGSFILQNDHPLSSSTTTTMVKDHKNYVSYAINSYKDFTDAEHNAIKLLYTLCQTKASLGTYQKTMKWHLSIMQRTPGGVKGIWEQGHYQSQQIVYRIFLEVHHV